MNKENESASGPEIKLTHKELGEIAFYEALWSPSNSSCRDIIFHYIKKNPHLQEKASQQIENLLALFGEKKGAISSADLTQKIIAAIADLRETLELEQPEKFDFKKNLPLIIRSSDGLRTFYESCIIPESCLSNSSSSNSLNSVSTKVSDFSSIGSIASNDTNDLLLKKSTDDSLLYPNFLHIYEYFLYRNEGLKKTILEECTEADFKSIIESFAKFSKSNPDDEMQLIFWVEMQFVIDAISQNKIQATALSYDFLADTLRYRENFAGAKSYDVPLEDAKNSQRSSFEWVGISFVLVAAYMLALIDFFQSLCSLKTQDAPKVNSS